MARNPGRPLSPHLTIWKWGPHMLVSILHRATGVGLATAGAMIFTWWLAAAASGPDAYATFHYYLFSASDGGTFGLFTNLLARVAMIGLTWAFFQHAATGLRHFVLDIGAGYELKKIRLYSQMTLVASIMLTLVLWAWIFTRN